jgi:hypothetical protein
VDGVALLEDGIRDARREITPKQTAHTLGFGCQDRLG